MIDTVVIVQAVVCWVFSSIGIVGCIAAVQYIGMAQRLLTSKEARTETATITGKDILQTTKFRSFTVDYQLETQHTGGRFIGIMVKGCQVDAKMFSALPLGGTKEVVVIPEDPRNVMFKQTAEDMSHLSPECVYCFGCVWLLALGGFLWSQAFDSKTGCSDSCFGALQLMIGYFFAVGLVACGASAKKASVLAKLRGCMGSEGNITVQELEGPGTLPIYIRQP